MPGTLSQLKASLIVVSDRIFQGDKPNHAADTAAAQLAEYGIELTYRSIIREDEDPIANELDARLGAGDDIIITLGGTGTKMGNVVPEVTAQRIVARMHGLETQVLIKGLTSSPKAGLSRGIIGMSALGQPSSLIINSAGSRGAVADTLDVVLPLIGDIFREC